MDTDSDRWIVIPRWEDFQHYKDRDPIWIRTYTRLLHNADYLDLTLSQRGILHGLWLMRAMHNENISEASARHLLVTNKAEARHWRGNLDALNHAGFIEVAASSSLAQRQKRVREEVVAATAVASYAAARTSQTNTGKRQLPADLLEQIAELDGADPRTPVVLASFLRRGLPEAAFRNALEATREAHDRLRTSEVAYFVGTLRQIEEDGQYA
jgi:hypothetical protein